MKRSLIGEFIFGLGISLLAGAFLLLWQYVSGIFPELKYLYVGILMVFGILLIWIGAKKISNPRISIQPRQRLIKKIFIFINNSVLFSYSIWKNPKEEIYKELKSDLKKDWITAQNAIFSGMIVPFIIFMIMISWDFFKDSTPQTRSLPMFIFIGYIIWYYLRSQKFFDKYTDEKFIELSKAKKPKKIKRT